MAKLRVYGYARSRTLRTLWMLEELGLPYDHVDLSSQAGGTRTPDFLKINPAGHIPAIDDDGFKLSESMAINLYLAKKHGKLQPATPQGEAKALQWSFWAAHEVDRQVVQWVINTTSLPDRTAQHEGSPRRARRTRMAAASSRRRTRQAAIPRRRGHLHRRRPQRRRRPLPPAVRRPDGQTSPRPMAQTLLGPPRRQTRPRHARVGR